MLQLTVVDEGGKSALIEVGDDQPLETLQLLVEVELGVPAAEQVFLMHGKPLPFVPPHTLLSVLKVPNGECLYVIRDRARPSKLSASSAPPSNGQYRSLADLPGNVDHAILLKACQDNPRLLKELEYGNAELAAAVKTGDAVKVRVVMMKQSLQSHKVKYDKDQQIAALNANPFDIEAQKKIEEMVRMENINKNMEVAMDEMPEAFGRVIMLYIDAEVAGVPIKAFVDSGAQSTIMSVDCAERCGLMRLVDTRFAGVAQGVGTCKILGRVHIAQLKVGRSFFPCTFTVLEKNDVDFLFGLDMLKRHQCVLDLKRGVLQLGASEEVPFLSEKDLPAKARGNYEGEGEGSSAATPMDTSKPPADTKAVASSSATSASSSGAAVAGGGSAVSKGMEELMGLGFSREQATAALERAGGDVQLAASLLYAELDG